MTLRHQSIGRELAHLRRSLALPMEELARRVSNRTQHRYTASDVAAVESGWTEKLAEPERLIIAIRAVLEDAK